MFLNIDSGAALCWCAIVKVDSVEGSTVLILNLSIAASDSHEGVSAILLASLRSRDVLLQFFEELLGLVVTGAELVGDLLLLDASH